MAARPVGGVREELKADVLKDLARLTRTTYLAPGPGSKERKASFVSAAAALGLSTPSGTKQEYAAAIARAGGQPWGEACVSTGDTVTLVGLQRVRAGAVALASARGARIRDAATRLVERELRRAAQGSTDPSSSRIRLRRLIRPGEVLVSPDAFVRSTPAAQRRVQLEKALVGHRRTLIDLSLAFGTDCEQFEDRASLDLLLRFTSGRSLLVEVKTVKRNPVDVARLAVAQLYEYRYRLRGDPPESPVLAICFDRPLGGPEWLLPYITDDRGINVLWPRGSGFATRGPQSTWLGEQLAARS